MRHADPVCIQDRHTLLGAALLSHAPTKRVVCGHACYVTSVVFNYATPQTVACQAPLPMAFSRMERGLPCPSPWELPDPGIEPTSPVSSAFSRFLPPEPPGKPKQVTWDFSSAVVFSFHEYTYNFCILFYSVINFLPTSFLIRERAVFVPEKKSRVAPKATVITNSQVTSAGKPLSSN